MHRILLLPTLLLGIVSSSWSSPSVRIALIAATHTHLSTPEERKQDQALYRSRFDDVIAQANAAAVDVVVAAGRMAGAVAQPSPAPTIVFMHYPPFVRAADEKGGTYWNIEPGPRARLLAMLKQAGIQTVLTRGVAPEGWTLVTVPPSGPASAQFKRI